MYLRDGCDIAFDCPVYAKWRKQIELEKKVMDSAPKKFFDKTFQNFKAISKDLEFAFNMSKKYAKASAWTKGVNLIIFGKYGVGKTHLAAAIIHEAIKHNFNAVLVTAPSLSIGGIDDIRKKFNSMRKFDLVAIDDFSSETSHKMVALNIFDLINYRYESEKGMVMTTNLTANELKNSLGDRIFDRVQERTAMVEISDVESYRKTKRWEYIDWMRR